jgi:uncharacterized Zn-binding protein involved in type VI secretion
LVFIPYFYPYFCTFAIVYLAWIHVVSWYYVLLPILSLQRCIVLRFLNNSTAVIVSAYGGTIVGPGCPTVLIGKMSAATLGDMHVCPMLTPGVPPIPHVGGPISLGSTGVFIGKKPAARMGDMAVCVGPPSSIILDCMTVLIGEAGGGGGGGGGSASAGAVISASIAGQPPPEELEDQYFLDVSFVDKPNLPVGGLSYALTFPDGSISKGVLGGQIKKSGVPEGDYEITLRGITNAQWSVRESEVGESVTLIVNTIGVEDGVKAALHIYMRDGNYTDHYLEKLNGEVSGDEVQVDWTMQIDEKYLKICDAKDSKKRFSKPFFFLVRMMK